MTAMEDRLRAVLHDDTRPMSAEAFLADVHAGARRRRVRRTAARVAAVAVVAAACVGVTAWWGSPGQDRRPEPADTVPRDSEQVMAPVPAPDGRLYGLAGTQRCDTGCPAVLWVEDEEGRARVMHEFTAEQSVSWVDFAPDIEHGFAFGQREDPDAATYLMVVWRTADGGRTWQQVDEQLAGYQYPPDVEYLNGDAYLLTRPVGPGSSSDPDPHLWRTPIDGDEWEEVALTDPVPYWFDMTAGLLALAGPDDQTEQLAVVRRDWVMVSDDGDEWKRSVELPCARQGGTGPMFAGGTPTTLLVWCPAPGERRVQLWRSVDLQPFEPLGPVQRHGHTYPTTYPALVGPLPVETRTNGAYAIVRTNDTLLRLEPDGRTTPVEGTPLLDIADVHAPDITHGGERTYVLTPDGRVVVTGDEGRTWSPLQG